MREYSFTRSLLGKQQQSLPDLACSRNIILLLNDSAGNLECIEDALTCFSLNINKYNAVFRDGLLCDINDACEGNQDP